MKNSVEQEIVSSKDLFDQIETANARNATGIKRRILAIYNADYSINSKRLYKEISEGRSTKERLELVSKVMDLWQDALPATRNLKIDVNSSFIDVIHLCEEAIEAGWEESVAMRKELVENRELLEDKFSQVEVVYLKKLESGLSRKISEDLLEYD